jgi:PAS domain-containing protein
VVDEVFEIPDGRLIRVVNRFMEAGGWVSTHEDVTQQHKAEAALKQAVAESERAEGDAIAAHMRLREAFEVVPEGLALFDAEDRSVLWNRRYAELYARTPNARSPNAIKVGARFEDVLRTGLAAGLFADAQGREQDGWRSAWRCTHKTAAPMSNGCRATAGCASASAEPPTAAASAFASISPNSSSARNRCARCSSSIRYR